MNENNIHLTSSLWSVYDSEAKRSRVGNFGLWMRILATGAGRFSAQRCGERGTVVGSWCARRTRPRRFCVGRICRVAFGLFIILGSEGSKPSQLSHHDVSTAPEALHAAADHGRGSDWRGRPWPVAERRQRPSSESPTGLTGAQRI
jgi:hypothetical protein